MERGDEKKKDHGKPMWDLLPWKQVGYVVDVITFGAAKYGPNQWQTVKDAKSRYYAAVMRHIVGWKTGELIDKESKKPSLAHAICCLLFLMWLDDNEDIGIETEDTLKAGDQVIRESDGTIGTVLMSGPYGDDPFQIQDTEGYYHAFIDDNGFSRYNADVWNKVIK